MANYERVGRVTALSGSSYYVYWKQESGGVMVAKKDAGYASSKSEAISVAERFVAKESDL